MHGYSREIMQEATRSTFNSAGYLNSARDSLDTTRKTHDTSTSASESRSGIASAPAAGELRRLMKRKEESKRRLEVIANRIKKMEGQEKSVWKRVSTTQRLSARAEEAQYVRQVRTFNSLQQEQSALQERHGKRNNALLQRISTQAGRDIRLQNFLINRQRGNDIRYESTSINQRLLDRKELDVEKKKKQVADVKQMKQVISAKLNYYHQNRHKDKRKETLEQVSNLQEELMLLEAEVEHAKAEEMRTLNRLHRTQIIRSETMKEFLPPPRISTDSSQASTPFSKSQTSLTRTEKRPDASLWRRNTNAAEFLQPNPILQTSSSVGTVKSLKQIIEECPTYLLEE